jgi:hypothetical protein
MGTCSFAPTTRPPHWWSRRCGSTPGCTPSSPPISGSKSGNWRNQHVEEVVASTSLLLVGHAAFDAAREQYPGSQLSLRQGIRVIEQSGFIGEFYLPQPFAPVPRGGSTTRLRKKIEIGTPALPHVRWVGCRLGRDSAGFTQRFGRRGSRNLDLRSHRGCGCGNNKNAHDLG